MSPDQLPRNLPRKISRLDRPVCRAKANCDPFGLKTPIKETLMRMLTTPVVARPEGNFRTPSPDPLSAVKDMLHLIHQTRSDGGDAIDIDSAEMSEAIEAAENAVSNQLCKSLN